MEEINVKHNLIAKGIGYIAWAYVVLAFEFYLNINEIRIDFIPDWLAYYLIILAIPILMQKEPSIALLRNLGTGLLWWTGIVWVLGILGAQIEFYIVNLCVAIVALYFQFQLITNIANIGMEYNETRSKKLLVLRNIKTVIDTACAFAVYQISSVTSVIATAVLIVIFIGVIMSLYICFELFALKNEIASRETIIA